ncbi:DinB family protein [Spirosoma sp. BT702]|uniref:DinB family protein n=1 Tax=Spirosoma profusum TaxID=2771354 RepID=A0A926XZI8_9BACT|nr:DinB family protein [Spirosoma profusum]MBD2700743.1 DinB family protein [Spirosoma profusum]
MTTESIRQMWQMSQAPSLGATRKLTPATYRHRLTAETASAGFIALHTAEVMHRFAYMLFGRPVSIPLQTVGGVSDEGQPFDLVAVQQSVEDAFAMITEQIGQLTDEQWAEPIPSPFGEWPRVQVLIFLMHHNSYHAGQIAQAAKKGTEVARLEPQP